MNFRRKKYNYISLLLFCIFCVLAIFLWFNSKTTTLLNSNGNYYLKYRYQGKEIKVQAQTIEADDCFHLFVPSYFTLDNIELPSSNWSVAYGVYSSEEGFIQKDRTEYDSVLAYDVSTKIVIHKLDNQTLFLELENDYPLEDIKNDINRIIKVESKVVNYNEKGKTLYNGKAKYFKGRGNSTWAYDKKSYSLAFESYTSLAGISLTKKYVLIPSYFDMTGMRNKLAYDFANKIGLENTSETSYVNLFVNGKYEGLYLLAQKVSIGNEKKANDSEYKTKEEHVGNGLKEIKWFNNINISNTSKYLLERDIFERYRGEYNAGFVTENDNAYVLHGSDNMAYKEVYEIGGKVKELEDAIWNNDFLDYIDLDSWAKQFLVELLFNNQDAYNTSSYFYYNIEDGKFYGGPVWDYDLTLGYGYVFVQNPKDLHLINSELANNEEFLNRVKEIFEDEVYEKKDEIIYKSTVSLSNQIKKDMYLNALRYNQETVIQSQYITEIYDYDLAVENLQGYLYLRIDEIEKVINDLNNYIMVKFVTNNINSDDTMIFVKKGTLISDEHEIPYYFNGNGFTWDKPLWISKWVDKDGNEFDFTKPITEDIELYAVWEGDTDASILQK